MKALSQYTNKTKAAFILLIVMLVIVLSNYNTLRNSKNVNENINAIYKDRLVVAGYIFEYLNEIHFIKSEAQNARNPIHKSEEIFIALKTIHEIDKLYIKTVLTSKEKIHFDAFMVSCTAISIHTKNKNWNEVVKTSDQAIETLELMSKIQVAEGKTKLASANEMYNNNNSLGQLQIALLVILGGITFYLLLLKKPKKSIKIPESPSMN
ncbi:hypothetical protein GON26_18375 [Flavobacterium sp. GA093]|uniref:Chemotaxis methyl-accepting receptor HlyB-like 4HB MCP domain-containing protein n=1 Tax=Flavobacterium hydrocarbonoxydans TaxID=2683249 RepID=A0A6I4NQ73_9FLAO|nr:hypothetical protein [Flavobacterium hydrocarbonoxydans]MWB96333.1 hypothetical protein [Flavobacterium hydrocarbonoxydans]